MKNRIVPIIITILLVLCAYPALALAADSTITSGGTYDISTYFNDGDGLLDTLTINTTEAVTLTNMGDIAATNFTISCGAGANLTLSGVTINNSSYNDVCPITFTGSGNTLTLATGTTNTLAGGLYEPAVRVEDTTELTIGGTGTLNAQGGGAAAGIGSGDSGVGGTIRITNGTINAAGGTESGDGLGGAGLGGGFGASSTSVEITGGSVTAQGARFSAGIGGGGGQGAGGTITISGGIVSAKGNEGGAGLGGGYRGSGGAITISGGVVYADGLELGYDIGDGQNSDDTGILSISGSAAVLLANNSCVSPTTTTHTHLAYTTDTETVYGISIPGAWTPAFGAYLRLVTLSYNAGSGSGTVDPVTQLYNSTASVSDGSALSRAYYTLSGWNTATDGSGTSYAAGSMFTFTADTTLYAQWLAHPTLTSSDEDGKIYTDGRITLTPNIAGGSWSYDSAYLSLSGYTFTALKSGTATITYTVEGQSVSYTVTIEKSELPSTGQNFAWVWLLGAIAMMATAAAIVIRRKYATHS